ncbi:basic helix-loop-helix transcription factor scleraxis-like [Apteryx mantelli]|uniref:Basic helix-loop-helix transcription factor scleraxis-like n=1 Tax=Apteryx mantelli TaxID=2696672 RepID=A0ABM4EPR8_9AVES
MKAGGGAAGAGLPAAAAGSGRRRERRGGGGGQRAAANARERDRTHSVNTAFSALRTLIPTEPADRRLSKVETLRLAASYIAHLANVLLLRPCPQRRPCPRPQPCPQRRPPRPVCTFCLSARRQRHRDGEKALSA